MKNYHSLADTLSDLKKRGYKAGFESKKFLPLLQQRRQKTPP